MKRFLSLALVLAMLLSGAAFASEAETTGKDWSKEEFITIDFYCGVANYSGIQSGWFGQIIKDKFNMEVNIIAPNVSGGNSLYQTRSAAGHLGDLVMASKAQIKDCVEAGIIMDITDYMDDCQYLPAYKKSIDNYKEYLGTDRVYGVPTRASLRNPVEPQSFGTSPSFGNFMRLDYYKEIGCPELKNEDDVLAAMKAMQELHPTTEDGSPVYGISMFKEWDGVLMKYPMTSIQNHGFGMFADSFVLMNHDGSEMQPADMDGGVYYNELKFYFKANQMGLVDPDSSAQNWSMLVEKTRNGQVLWSMWPWASVSHFNTTDRTQQGQGFLHIPVADQVILVDGYNPYGDDNGCLALGAKCKDPERVMAFLDWLAAPEYYELVNAGPQGLTWEVVDGKAVLTDYGRQAMDTAIDTTNAPEELGGGNYTEGRSQFNTGVGKDSNIDPLTGEPYETISWSSTIQAGRSKLDDNWTEVFGAFSAMDYLQEKNMLQVAPGCTYAVPADSSEIATMRAQCGEIFVNASWNMIFAPDEETFNALWEQMKEDLRGFGYEDVLAVDYARAEELKASRAAAMETAE